MATERPRRRRRGGVTAVGDEHNAQVADFFTSSWDQASTPDSIAEWRARDARLNPVNPGHESPKWIFSKDDAVIGYLGSVPARFFAEGNESIAHWLKGFWVLPEYRGGPVGAAILQQAMTDLDVISSTVVAEPARRLMESQGMADLGRMFNRLLVLRPGRLLSRLDVDGLSISGVLPTGVRFLQRTRTTALAGAGVKMLSGLTAALRGRPAGGLRQETGWDSADVEQLDSAWEGFRGTVRAAAVRDGAMIRWRYAHEGYYDVATIWDGSELVAWAVVRVPRVEEEGRLKGIAIASLSDVLFPVDRPTLGLAAVAAAERLASEMGADALLCTGSHTVLDSVLARRGFFTLPPNLHFLLRPAEAPGAGVPLSEWWLTRGDGRSDESF